MRISVVREIKPAERRVALTDAGARALVAEGHEVLVESGAGVGSGIPDEAYERAGAKIVGTDDAWAAELVVKVKEPVAAEYGLLSEESVLFTYLHLAADRPLTQALLDNRVTAIAYETVVDDRGELPLLKPMSEVAGRLAAHAAGQYLMHPYGGPGLLLGGSPGVPPAKVTVLGGGVVGTQAASLAVGMRADVTILDTSSRRVRELEEHFGRSAHVLQSAGGPAISALQDADVVIGAVLVPGAAAPKLLTRSDLGLLKPDALLIDVAIDQGGCFETSRPTTHDAPTYVVDGITHYCVANMPGAVPRTSTRALTNATLPYVRRLAGLGVDEALERDPGLRSGLNTRAGTITHDAVAAAFR
ncbi:alanine dehydrogenase [Promicromonospora soli]|uniref:Alanine dehydrogenase n=1 Tax=Promicromonospora soli TaxID=2035533 RepID=A0A919FHF0_9MICO|nr:alanine dehydrogenase [Promicromonospora soli]GHH65578.1 alanine dehydrogenase [Promicromonospora soli]